jgi:putative endonuclease
MPGSENSASIMFFYVYVLQSIKTKGLYVGYTSDLQKRLKEHNRGLNFSTKPYMPWQLIHYEAYLNEEDAKRREKYLETNQGSRLLKRMLKEYFYLNKFK